MEYLQSLPLLKGVARGYIYILRHVVHNEPLLDHYNTQSTYSNFSKNLVKVFEQIWQYWYCFPKLDILIIDLILFGSLITYDVYPLKVE